MSRVDTSEDAFSTQMERELFARIDERERVRNAAPALLEALQLWLAYDQDADPETVDFMLAYDRALTATKAAISLAQGETVK